MLRIPRNTINYDEDEQKIIDHLNNGGSIVIKVAGTTFESIETGENRQDILSRLSENPPDDMSIKLEKQLDNKYDKDAICVRLLTNEDIGYIPRKGSVSLEVVRGKRIMHNSISCSRINTILRKMNLEGEIMEIVGGFAGGSYGVNLILHKLN
jgi:hypothetical protein